MPGKIIIVQSLISSASDLRKGDVLGHPFHGNQYAEGEYGSTRRVSDRGDDYNVDQVKSFFMGHGYLEEGNKNEMYAVKTVGDKTMHVQLDDKTDTYNLRLTDTKGNTIKTDKAYHMSEAIDYGNAWLSGR